MDVNRIQKLAITRVKRMFQERGYSADVQVSYDATSASYHLYTRNLQDEPVWVLLTPVVHISQDLGDVNEWEHMGSDPMTLPETTEVGIQDDAEHQADAKVDFTRKSIGNTFFQSCLEHCKTREISEFICVADHASPVVRRIVREGVDPSLFMTWFHYEEICLPCMLKHTLQPYRFTHLTPEEQKAYCATHPRYEAELPKIEHTDIVLRYLGVRPGHILYIEESDYQGLHYQTEYLIAC
jgi:DNA-directed RNA polymerase subunit H (RpoH/RPB5)